MSSTCPGASEKWWSERRRIESNGFVAKRLASRLIRRYALAYGTAMCMSHGELLQIVAPWEVTVRPPCMSEQARGEKHG
jgi:hypothetical protein